MENSKKALFVRKMGKKRLSLAKGGMIPRKKYGLGGLLGLDGGAGGTGFATNPGATPAQLSTAYNTVQDSLGKQTGLVDTLTPQAASAVGSQNVLANQFANQANGNGPNVAMNKLNQATSANVANLASLMAGQRGAAVNPALLAREAAMQGANTQQQAAGQGATMQAEQQIASEQAGAQLAANQIAQTQGATSQATQAAQGEQNILENANTANNNIQGQFANTTMQGQQGIIGGLMNGAGSALGLAGLSEGGEVSAHHDKKLEFVHKMTELGLKHHGKGTKMAEGGPVPSPTPEEKSPFGLGLPKANADLPPMDPDKAKQVSDSFKNVFADGGLAVPQVNYQAPQVNFQQDPSTQGGFSVGSNAGAAAMGNSMKGKKKDKPGGDIPGQSVFQPATVGDPGASDMMAAPATDFSVLAAAHGGMMKRNHVANYLMADGGKVPALVSPGEIFLKPDQVAEVEQGADPLKIGSRFPGKAKVKGDSTKNDFIPADLDDGGVVIDRENAYNSKKAMKFVHKSIAKKKARGK